jgi:hypothetical protein
MNRLSFFHRPGYFIVYIAMLKIKGKQWISTVADFVDGADADG